jgi:hypothetical protein
VHQKQLLNLTIKKLIGEATADELLTLESRVKSHKADAFFVNTITDWFNTDNETDDGQSELLFKRVKGKITDEPLK